MNAPVDRRHAPRHDSFRHRQQEQRAPGHRHEGEARAEIVASAVGSNPAQAPDQAAKRTAIDERERGVGHLPRAAVGPSAPARNGDMPQFSTGEPRRTSRRSFVRSPASAVVVVEADVDGARRGPAELGERRDRDEIADGVDLVDLAAGDDGAELIAGLRAEHLLV